MPLRAPRSAVFALAALAVGTAGCTRTLVLDADEDPDDGSRVCVPARAPGFRLPSARWALAAAHAAHRLRDDPDDPLPLPPAFFLAVGWAETGFSCAAYGPPWVAEPEAAGEGGCLALDEGTAWNELAVLWPGLFPADGFAGAVDGDQPEAAALTLAWSVRAAHALWGREAVAVDPAGFYASTGDPRALPWLAAAHHVGGPWTDQVPRALADCPDDVGACLTGDVEDRTTAIVDRLDTLTADGDCLDEPLAAEVVEAHLDALRPRWAADDWDQARRDALAALDGSGFSTEAPAVLAALDRHLIHRLTCPEDTLWQVYRFSCP